MINITNQSKTGMLFFLVFFLSFFALTYDSAIAIQEFDEDAELVLATDTITIGIKNQYSTRSIIVDDYEYDLCKEVKIFNLGNMRMPLQDLDAALKVKLFVNGINCVRKIKVLSFAQ